MVTEADRRWFCSLSAPDITSLNKDDDVFRGAIFFKAQEEGLDSTAAARRCWRYFPYYYTDPNQRGRNPLAYDGVDAELPFLVKDTVNRLAAGGELTRDFVEGHTTMNAAIRKMIHKSV